MPAAKPQPVKPATIALICIAAVAMMFAGSIIIGITVVKAERTAPAQDSSEGP
jgi:hypothetical protein